MGCSCEARNFSKKICNIVSGEDCISYSKTECLLFNPQTSNRPTSSLSLPQKRSGRRGQPPLFVLITMTDASNQMKTNKQTRILTILKYRSGEMGHFAVLLVGYLFLFLLFCFLGFASNLGGYQLVYISTGVGHIQTQPPSQVCWDDYSSIFYVFSFIKFNEFTLVNKIKQMSNVQFYITCILHCVLTTHSQIFLHYHIFDLYPLLQLSIHFDSLVNTKLLSVPMSF